MVYTWPKREWPEAVPRFVTPRNYDRDTLGPELVDTMRRLGFEPMPWNVDMWDTMFEYTLVDTPFGVVKRLWYREGRITVPRQSSKTMATLVRHVHRCLRSEELGWTRPGESAVCAFTMQTQTEAAKKMREVWHPMLDPDLALTDVAREDVERVVKSNGGEAVKFRNRARIGVFPPSIKGGHGDTVDAVDVDEAFAFPDDRAEQGARPSMITRPSPQIVVQSTQGTMESTYFNDKCMDGRARVEAAIRGKESRIYYLEYSCGPEDDINNPLHWPRWMPALGYTIGLDAVEMEHEAMKPDAFMRAYGNVRTGHTNQIIPAEMWANCYRPRSFRDGKAWMAIDASPGLGGAGRSGSIVVASYRDDRVRVEVIRHGDGIMWMPEAIGVVTRQHRVQGLYVDATGPIGSILPEIEKKSMANIVEIDSRTMANACGRFHQAVLDRTLEHGNQSMLDAAVEGADKRSLEDAWAWKRRTSSNDISPLVAATLAHWGAVVDGKTGLVGMG